MVETNEENRYKLCAEIVESLKEYSTEDIDDPELAKLEIIELLKAHRPIKNDDYQYGLSLRLQRNHRIIIKESEDGSKVREYYRSRNSWSCSYNKCNTSSVKIKYGIVFAPINHNANCKTKEYLMVMKIQDLLKQGKTKEAYGLSRKRKIFRYNNSDQSLSTSMLSESTDTDQNDSSIHVESVTQNTTSSSINATLTSPTSQQSSPTIADTTTLSPRSSVKREIKEEKNDDECVIIEEPVAKRPKMETESPSNAVFEFNRPSSLQLKQICKKLNIDPNNNAYKLWGDIVLRNILSCATNIYSHSFKSQNIFACLSLLFTGKNNSCFLIQHAINEAFRNDLMTSGTKTSDEVDEILINNVASDEQIEFIAKFLFCRIGIYYDGVFKKFGKWEQNEEDVLTLILSFEAGCFSVALDLA